MDENFILEAFELNFKLSRFGPAVEVESVQDEELERRLRRERERERERERIGRKK